jgi:hypothetical protein
LFSIDVIPHATNIHEYLPHVSAFKENTGLDILHDNNKSFIKCGRETSDNHNVTI